MTDHTSRRDAKGDDLLKRDDVLMAAHAAIKEVLGATAVRAKLGYAIEDALDKLPTLDADGRKKLDPFVEIQLAQQAVKDWVEGFARLQDAKMDDPAKCDAEALAKAMHAAYEKHGCIEENINPLGALECAKVVIQDWSDRLAPTLYRKEYRDGVVNGLKNAMGLIDCLMATVFVVKGEEDPAPPAAERRPAVERPDRPTMLLARRFTGMGGIWVWLTRKEADWACQWHGSDDCDYKSRDLLEVDRNASDSAALALYDADISTSARGVRGR
jgi:hypothetical protein